jgi:hypothetical protein
LEPPHHSLSDICHTSVGAAGQLPSDTSCCGESAI